MNLKSSQGTVGRCSIESSADHDPNATLINPENLTSSKNKNQHRGKRETLRVNIRDKNIIFMTFLKQYAFAKFGSP